MSSPATPDDGALVLLYPDPGNWLAVLIVGALCLVTGLLGWPIAWWLGTNLLHYVVVVGNAAALVTGVAVFLVKKLPPPRLILGEHGIDDHLHPRHPFTIPREEIEAVVLYRNLRGRWLGLRVRDRDAMLAPLPRRLAWHRCAGLPDGVSFALCDDYLPVSLRRLAREIQRRYGVPVGLGPGMGSDSAEQDAEG